MSDTKLQEFCTNQQDILEFICYMYPVVWKELIISDNDGCDEIAIIEFATTSILHEYINRFKNKKKRKFSKLKPGMIVGILKCENFVKQLPETYNELKRGLLQTDQNPEEHYLRIIIGITSYEQGKRTLIPMILSRLKKSSEVLVFTQTLCCFVLKIKAIIKCGCNKYQYCSEECKNLHWENVHNSICPLEINLLVSNIPIQNKN